MASLQITWLMRFSFPVSVVRSGFTLNIGTRKLTHTCTYAHARTYARRETSKYLGGPMSNNLPLKLLKFNDFIPILELKFCKQHGTHINMQMMYKD